MTTKELDNIVFAIIAEAYISAYTKNEHVVLDDKMKSYLSLTKTHLRKIQKYYNTYEVTQKQMSICIERLKKYADTQSSDKSGQEIELTTEDQHLISILDTVMFAYNKAIEKSRKLPKEVLTAMRKSRNYWILFEKYIVSI